jgi:hypothetical protein
MRIFIDDFALKDLQKFVGKDAADVLILLKDHRSNILEIFSSGSLFNLLHDG